MNAPVARAEDVVRLVENCFVRAAPSAAGAVLGVMKRGDALPRAGELSPDGWLAVAYRGVVGWVSGQFAEAAPGRGTVPLNNDK